MLLSFEILFKTSEVEHVNWNGKKTRACLWTGVHLCDKHNNYENKTKMFK